MIDWLLHGTDSVAGRGFCVVGFIPKMSAVRAGHDDETPRCHVEEVTA